MVTAINIFFSIIFLLPGFILIKIRHSTSEYRELTIFEYTTTSIGYSLIIFLLWILYQYILESITFFDYEFFIYVERIIISKQYSIIFTGFFTKFILSYLNIVLLFAVFIYNIYWTKVLKKIKHLLGHNRFTDHLTPWEDFLIINQNNWLVIELKDGSSIMGKIGFHSHSPFEKEFVLKRVNETPITIYDKEKVKVNFGPDIDQSFITTEEIKVIHSVIDENIEPQEISISKYLCILVTYLVFLIFTMLFFSLLILNLCVAKQFSFLINIFLFIPFTLSLFWNMISLKDIP